jgi:hypothetical protein
MTYSSRALIGAALLAVLLMPTFAFASHGGQDRVQFFQSIDVTAEQQVGEAVCIFCSIRISGTANGDVVAILGSIDVQGQAKGDVVAVGGSIRLGEDASVAGDTVGLGGGVSRHPNATVKGDTVSQANPLIFIGLFLGVVVIPLLPFALFVWLIVWLVRGNRRPQYSQVPYRR